MPWARATSWLAAAALLYLLALAFDWAVLHAVFRADLAACQALAHQGACWGVVTEKIRPLLLGQYPFDAQWRPLLSLGVAAVCALGWAASVWRVGGWSLQGWRGTVLTLACALAFLLLLGGGFAGLSSVPLGQWGGLPLTILLTVLTLALSLPLGTLLALGRRSARPCLSWPCTAFIELVRGVPLVTLLFLAAFMLPAVFPAGWQPGLFARVSAVLTLFSSAYLAELVRAGIQTVPHDQVEAAQVLGLRGWRIQQLVVLPQALRAVLPALVSHCIGLLKDTSLVMVVSLHELTGALGLALGGDADWRPFYLEAYLFVAAVYALMCLSLARVGQRLEQRWQATIR